MTGGCVVGVGTLYAPINWFCVWPLVIVAHRWRARFTISKLSTYNNRTYHMQLLQTRDLAMHIQNKKVLVVSEGASF